MIKKEKNEIKRKEARGEGIEIVTEGSQVLHWNSAPTLFLLLSPSHSHKIYSFKDERGLEGDRHWASLILNSRERENLLSNFLRGFLFTSLTFHSYEPSIFPYYAKESGLNENSSKKIKKKTYEKRISLNVTFI